MRNYQDEQNKNYENTKQMFEACRKDVGDSKKARRTMPIVDDEICFAARTIASNKAAPVLNTIPSPHLCIILFYLQYYFFFNIIRYIILFVN